MRGSYPDAPFLSRTTAIRRGTQTKRRTPHTSRATRTTTPGTHPPRAAYRPKRVGFGLVGFVPGSAVVEVGPVNCGSPPVDLGLCLGAVAGLVELVNDLFGVRLVLLTLR